MTVTPGVQITRDRVSEVLATLRALTSHEVLVGVPASTSPRAVSDGEKASADNALLGYVHEFGSPAANIPPRPFLVPGVRAVSDQIARRLSRGAELAMSGSAIAAMQALDAAGMIAASGAQRRLTEGPHVPLKPATLAARRRRGRTGERPLVDTGQLRRAITHVVRERDR